MYGNNRRTRMHGLSLNSFADVEATYNNTKPVVSKNHTRSQDVRPVGERRRKWERVKKISNNCYILLAGFGLEDDVFGWHNRTGKRVVSVAEQVAFAAICWQRDAQGVETIKIRNGIGDHAHNSHYRFLEEALPRGLEFHINNGKQFVKISIVGHTSGRSGTYYLPKTRCVPNHVLLHRSNLHPRIGSVQLNDDGAFLTFTRVGTCAFKFSGNLHTIPKPPRKVVDVELKGSYKQSIAEYLKWISAVAPMLRVDDWSYLRDMQTEINDHVKLHSNDQRYIGWGKVPYAMMLEVVTEADHPLRLHMALDFVSDYGTVQHIKSKEDAKRVRDQYNRWINKRCGFIKTIRETGE